MQVFRPRRQALVALEEETAIVAEGLRVLASMSTRNR